MTRLILVLGLLAGGLAVPALVATYALTQSLADLDRRGQSDLALASDRLVSGLFGFRQLTVSLAADPRLSDPATGAEDLEALLLRATDISGALDFVVLDRDRRFVASASGAAPEGWTTLTFVARAFNGALGRHLTTSAASGRRVFLYAAPVYGGGGPVPRVLVAVIDLEAIEADFRGSRPAVFMTDRFGTVYFSNRSELIFRDRAPEGPGENFVDHRVRMIMGHEVWTVSAERYLPRWALHVDRPLPVIDMHAEALVDLGPALADAGFQALAAGAVVLLLGGIIFFVGQQRRVLAQANAALEERVLARTQELRAANASLQQENAERREAEQALKKAQQDLIQAGKLSALGKMTAGISHELNQPLTAIQSFSNNAAVFLDRGNLDTARGNMLRVSDMAERMARIIRNFRAFARQEKDAVHKVDLTKSLAGAVDLARNRLDQEGVDLQMTVPDTPVWVQGGEVRLQQVALNLISNAIDAMAQSAERRIALTVTPGDPTILTVQDSGPGIDAPDKVFEPFYSTKEIGPDEGVGLGLSISYGLVQSFGGKIRGQNAPQGGAVFTVELNPWDKETTS